MDEKKDSHIVYYGLAVLIFVAISVIGISFAYWSVNLEQTDENVITTGCLSIAKASETGAINLTGAVPITDTAGKQVNPLTLKVQNTCDSAAKYQVNLDILSDTNFPLGNVKYQFGTSEPAILGEATTVSPYAYTDGTNATTSKQLGSGTIAASGSETFTLKLWVDSETPLSESTQSKTFKGKLVVSATPS